MSDDTSGEPRNWTTDDVERFASHAEAEEVSTVLKELLRNPDETAVGILLAFLGTTNGNTFLKPVPSQLAVRALLSLGPRGVEALMSRLRDDDQRTRYASNVLAVIWNVGRGRGLQPSMNRVSDQLLNLALPDGTQQAAAIAMRDLFAEARVSTEAFWIVTRFLSDTALRMAYKEDSSGDAAVLMSVFAEGAIKLSRSVLDEFADLIKEELVEERYQEFLAAHPVILDPLAAEVVPKQRLGVEHATDFAIRRHDDRWLLVEIERPQDDLFTGADDFRSRFTHAFGQVLDFQSWVDENAAYAQKLMPQIAAPHGLLVMGLRSRLSSVQKMKLRRFTTNSRRIDVVTYDDLHARATSLYENLLDAPK
jgi:hypothetical protein